MTDQQTRLLSAQIESINQRMMEDGRDERVLWMARRQALLMEVDAIERAFCLEPRTAELRKAEKEARRQTE